MKIFYGIQGTGNGHITRARVMAHALSQREDVQVDYYFSGRPEDKYFDMECFGNYRTAKGLTFATEQGQVRMAKTVADADVIQFIRDVRALDLSAYDLVINDFEPVSAWAAKRQGVFTINISHQSSMLHKMDFLATGRLTRLGVKAFAPADIHLGVHWYHFGHQIIPPFIEIEPRADIVERKILVYLPFEDLRQVQDLLASYPEYNFVCYHPDVEYPQEFGHINLEPLSREKFPQDLATCEGVVANSGFELSSESLCLGKKLLLKPLQGQVEQTFNAQTLEKLGLANVMLQLDETLLEPWLERAGNQPISYPKVPDVLVDWICQGNWQQVDLLCEQLWQQVKFPDPVLAKLRTMHPSAQDRVSLQN